MAKKNSNTSTEKNVKDSVKPSNGTAIKNILNKITMLLLN